MWICRNCGTENEENFRFCWSCGRTHEQSKSVEEKKANKETVKNIESKRAPGREIKSVEEIKPVEITKVEKRKSTPNEPELFSSIMPYSAKSPADLNGEFDWEVKIFRIALRLAGLFLLYRVFVSLPDLVFLIHSSLHANNLTVGSILISELTAPIAKILFYFITGIYLIASGRILLRLLPGR